MVAGAVLGKKNSFNSVKRPVTKAQFALQQSHCSCISHTEPGFL